MLTTHTLLLPQKMPKFEVLVLNAPILLCFIVSFDIPMLQAVSTQYNLAGLELSLGQQTKPGFNKILVTTVE